MEGRGRGTYRRGQCRTVWRWGNARTEDLASCWSALEGHSKNRGARERKENGPRLPLSSAISRRDIREHGTVTHSSMRITNVVKRWLETIASRIYRSNWRDSSCARGSEKEENTLPEARHEEHVTLNIETRHEGILRKVTKQTFSFRQEILNNTWRDRWLGQKQLSCRSRNGEDAYFYS